MAFCVSNSAIFQAWKLKSTPRSLFGWNFGKKNPDNEHTPQPNYHHNIDLPFPLSLVDKTFLRGNFYL